MKFGSESVNHEPCLHKEHTVMCMDINDDDEALKPT